MKQDYFMGTVIFTNRAGYAIIEDGEGRVYIAAPKGYYTGEELIFDRKTLKRMPSLLYAMVEIGQITRNEIKEFIEGEDE